MTETKIYCDHCGKVLDCKEDYDDINIDTYVDWIEADLCKQCLHDLSNVVRTFCSGLKFKQSQEIK